MRTTKWHNLQSPSFNLPNPAKGGGCADVDKCTNLKSPPRGDIDGSNSWKTRYLFNPIHKYKSDYKNSGLLFRNLQFKRNWKSCLPRLNGYIDQPVINLVSIYRQFSNQYGIVRHDTRCHNHTVVLLHDINVGQASLNSNEFIVLAILVNDQLDIINGGGIIRKNLHIVFSQLWNWDFRNQWSNNILCAGKSSKTDHEPY